MKQINTTGWLVMAAAIMTTLTACSGDDPNDQTTNAPNNQATVSVSVNAGIDEAATRSAVVVDDQNHTLQFTTGDRLLVMAMYGSAESVDGTYYYEHILRGYLTMVGSPSADGKSASFSGTLTQYDRTGSTADGYTYSPVGNITVSFTEDPLADCAKDGSGNPLAFATLIHKDAVAGTDFTDEGWNIYYNWNCLATDVNTLMTKYLAVTSPTTGGYDATNKSFKLNDAPNPPILNCTISGLTANATYTVTYDIDGYNDCDLSPTVTADADGIARFAFFGDESSENHALKFTNTTATETKTATLGNKKLTEGFKIFNVSRTAQ